MRNVSGGRFGSGTDPADVPKMLDALGDGTDVAVVVLHHWMLEGGREPHPVVAALARVRVEGDLGNLRAADQTLEGRALFRRAG